METVGSPALRAGFTAFVVALLAAILAVAVPASLIASRSGGQVPARASG